MTKKRKSNQEAELKFLIGGILETWASEVNYWQKCVAGVGSPKYYGSVGHIVISFGKSQIRISRDYEPFRHLGIYTHTPDVERLYCIAEKAYKLRSEKIK